jgi:phosphoribosyl-dephospho-CoA transferase
LHGACAKLQFKCHNAALRRHDLVHVSALAWRGFLEGRGDLSRESLIAEWVERGRPFVVRRSAPEETDGLALGLPLPPYAGKRRIAFQMQHDAIVSRAPPPSLSATLPGAPIAWAATLDRLKSATARYGVEARVFGSLAWRTLTGLEYLTPDSDLDLLLSMPRERELGCLTTELLAIEQAAPMRLDGEWVREDGASVNWRELHAGARQVLVKTVREVALVDSADFLAGGTWR